MAPALNLLADTPSGNTWIEGALDLEAEDFSLEHVRGLRRGLAALAHLPVDSLPIVSIERWAPIVVLQMPADVAERAVRAFERSDPEMLRVFDGLPLDSLKLDTDNAVRFSRPPAASRRDDILALVVELAGQSWKVVLFGAKALAYTTLAIIGGLVTAIGVATEWLSRQLLPKDWLGTRSSEDWARAVESRLRAMVEDLWRLLVVGYRIPDKGWSSTSTLLWTPELNESLIAAKGPKGWSLRGSWLILREFLRTGICSSAAGISWLAIFASFVAGEVRELARRVYEDFASRESGRDERPIEFEPSSHRSEEPFFEDPNDWLFLRVVLGVVAIAALLRLLTLP